MTSCFHEETVSIFLWAQPFREYSIVLDSIDCVGIHIRFTHWRDLHVKQSTNWFSVSSLERRKLAGILIKSDYLINFVEANFLSVRILLRIPHCLKLSLICYISVEFAQFLSITRYVPQVDYPLHFLKLRLTKMKWSGFSILLHVHPRYLYLRFWELYSSSNVSTDTSLFATVWNCP